MRNYVFSTAIILSIVGLIGYTYWVRGQKSGEQMRGMASEVL